MQQIKKAIKQILIDLAADDKLPTDLYQLDENVFDAALKPVVDEFQVLYNCTEEALRGLWDRSDKGFEAMQIGINTIIPEMTAEIDEEEEEGD